MTVAEFIDNFYVRKRGILYIVNEDALDWIVDSLDSREFVFRKGNDVDVIVALEPRYMRYETGKYLNYELKYLEVKHFIVDEETEDKYLLVKVDP